MKKLLVASIVLLSFSASAQTLFTYGKDSVSVKDFVQAFRKNNSAKSEAAFKEYLDLYIASRLKIKEATDSGYDTLPQFVAELENLKAQIMPAYLNDQSAMGKLVNEAFTRSQKDIQLAHIFISFQQNGVYDTSAARNKAEEVLKQLQKGKTFSDVAKQYSDDPAAKTTGGALGWITVFSLPYELENLAFSTPKSKTSGIYKSKAGYHIFKNVAERKALGRIKAAQILLAFSPEADAAAKERTRLLADSIYNRLQKGDDFSQLATEFSNDVISAASGGLMQEFGVGEYDPVFEQNVFALVKDNDISKPFATAHGYHIVKRVSRIPAAASRDERTTQHLKIKIESSDRIQWAQKALAQKILKEAGYKKGVYNENALWMYTDSMIHHKRGNGQLQLNASTALFKLGNKDFTVADWTQYVMVYGHKHDGSPEKPFDQLWNEFLEKTAIDHYQNHLEQFNEAFKKQLNEFRDGNLFFEIMQRKVWEPAQTDTAGLKAFYEKNRSNYKWNSSAAAVIFFASDANGAITFLKELRKKPSEWKSLLQNFNDNIAADSGRFELQQIPNAGNAELKNGSITSPVVNKTDNTASFAYIIQTFDNPEQKTFAEAKGQVVNDYQALLEKTWMEQLYKKYPVHINQKALNNVIKNKSW